MFRQAQRKSDLEGNHGGHVTRDMLDFRDPSWIIEHHRRSIITKIYKPGESWLDVLFGQRSETNTDSYHNRERPRDGHSPQAVTDEIPLGLSSQQSKGGTGTIHAQLGGSEQSYRINFSELQRLRLRQLQHKLVQHAIDLRYDAMEPSGWAEDLREYVQALQDSEYMGKFILLPQDPFIVTGERLIERRMLQVAMRDKENEADSLEPAECIVKWETSNIRPNPILGTRDGNLRQTWIRGFQQRLGIAAVGGIFLIAPMWLIVLHRTLYTALVSTTAEMPYLQTSRILLKTRLLLDKGVDVNTQGDEYGNALYTASENGHQEIIKLPLDKGADVNAQGGIYGNALQAASLGCYHDIVKLLLKKGADVNMQSGEYCNALQAPSLQGYHEIVKLLQRRGAITSSLKQSGSRTQTNLEKKFPLMDSEPFDQTQ